MQNNNLKNTYFVEHLTMTVSEYMVSSEYGNHGVQKKKKKTHTRLCQENFKGMYRCYLLHEMYQSVIDFVTCRVERKVKSEFLMKRKLRYQL